MEVNTQRRAAGLRDKIPDIKKTLDTVRFLKTRKPNAEPLETHFELNDTLYAKAQVPATEEVYLWLGANVMLAYPIEEAETLLGDKLEAAQSGLVNCEEDLDFLREQITVRPPTHVGIGRMLTRLFRRSRLRRPGCITGMLDSGEKNEKVARVRKRTEAMNRMARTS